MIAHIDAREQTAERIHGKGRGDFDAMTYKVAGAALEKAARADGVDQQTAVDAAAAGANEGVAHAAADFVVNIDIEQQGNVVLGGVEIGDQPIDGLPRFGNQLGPVAAEDGEAAQFSGDVENGVLRLLDRRRSDMAHVDARLMGPLDYVYLASMASDATGAEADFAEE